MPPWPVRAAPRHHDPEEKPSSVAGTPTQSVKWDNPMKIIRIAAISSTLAIGAALCAPDMTRATPPATAPDAARCASLAGLRIGDAVIDTAVHAGAGGAKIFVGRPTPVGLCHIRARIVAEPGSDVRTEVWLPDNWNGKLLATGGGGFQGGLNSGSAALLPPTVAQGYASVANNAGHDGDDLNWALSPPKLTDFAYRANYRATLFAKGVIATYYRRTPERTYFSGCSNGGRDALIQAQRFPEEYDGIVSAAPANNWTGLLTSFVWQRDVMGSAGAASLEGKLGLLHDAVMAKCDAADGVKDDLLENPLACRFDPAVLACKPGVNGPTCLSGAEVSAARQIYQGPRMKNGTLVHPGMPLGSELEWKGSITGSKDTLSDILGIPYFRWFVHRDPAWNPDGFALDRDYRMSKERMASLFDATNTDLRPFARAGGKLLMWHGWDDSAIGAMNSITYYKAASRRLGKRADQMKLFMAPGVRHCALGRGPGIFDAVDVLDKWVESGRAPDRIVATKYENDIAVLFLGQASKVKRTRPLCPFPRVAKYQGAGSIDDEANFMCVKP